MTRTTENTKKTSADFTRHFDFLTKDYGLKMSMENCSTAGGDRYVRVLRNEFVQVELAGDQSYFHAEIRRLINGEPCPYADDQNNIGFEALAVLITNNNYDHLAFYPASAGWIKVLENTAEVFRKSKEVFTTDKWVDTRRIENLKDEEFFKKFGFRPSEEKHKPTFFGLIKRHALALLDKGYKCVLDSSDLPPYNNDSLTIKLILEGAGKKIKISQVDWRDYYFIYYIEVNGQKLFEVDLNDHADIEAAAKIFNDKIDNLTS